MRGNVIGGIPACTAQLICAAAKMHTGEEMDKIEFNSINLYACISFHFCPSLLLLLPPETVVHFFLFVRSLSPPELPDRGAEIDVLGS